jgi:hypothetical protein
MIVLAFPGIQRPSLLIFNYGNITNVDLDYTGDTVRGLRLDGFMSVKNEQALIVF